MEDLKTYPEGTPFTGTIGRTASESVAAWPMPPRARAGAPNVLVLLLDDVGFAQLGCFGADIRTPTFDRLAAAGLRYRDFHTTAICSPTRACLLTGRNHHSNGVGIIQEMATGFPGYNGMVPRENGFLSEMLLAAGYATFAIGKWHLTLAASTRPERRRRAGRSRAGSSATTASSAARPTSGRPRWSTTATTSTRRRRPEEGYHLNADLADRAIEFLTDLRTVAPREAVLHVLLPRCRTRAAPRRAGVDRALPRAVRWRVGPLARAGLRAPARDGHRPGGDPALAAAAVGEGVGHPLRRRAAALRAPDGGVRRRSSNRPTTTSGACSTFSRGSASSTTRSSCSPRTTARAPRAASTARSTSCSSPTGSSRRSSRTSRASTNGAASGPIPTTPGAGPGPATRRCSAGSVTCTRAA